MSQPRGLQRKCMPLKNNITESLIPSNSMELEKQREIIRLANIIDRRLCFSQLSKLKL